MKEEGFVGGRRVKIRGLWEGRGRMGGGDGESGGRER